MSVTKNIRFCLRIPQWGKAISKFHLFPLLLIGGGQVGAGLHSDYLQKHLTSTLDFSPLFSICILAFNSISSLRCKSRTSVAVKSALDSIQIICNDPILNISPPLWTSFHFFYLHFFFSFSSIQFLFANPRFSTSQHLNISHLNISLSLFLFSFQHVTEPKLKPKLNQLLSTLG